MPLLFNRIEFNPDTGCLEAFLEGESDSRTDIPANIETLQSLIELLTIYVEDWD